MKPKYKRPFPQGQEIIGQPLPITSRQEPEFVPVRQDRGRSPIWTDGIVLPDDFRELSTNAVTIVEGHTFPFTLITIRSRGDVEEGAGGHPVYVKLKMRDGFNLYSIVFLKRSDSGVEEISPPPGLGGWFTSKSLIYSNLAAYAKKSYLDFEIVYVSHDGREKLKANTSRL